MQTDLITKVYFNEHLTHSCVGMPQGLQALLSSYWSQFHLIYPYLALIYNFFTYLGLFTPILISIFTQFSLIYPDLVIFALRCPELTISAIFTICILLLIQKSRHESSLGVNLVIDNFFDVASDTSTLYQIWKQSDDYLWRYCILKICGGIQSVVRLWTKKF